MEQVENQLLIDLPNLAQTIAQLKQIVVPPVGGALNPPVNLGQNGINQTNGSGFNAPNNPGVHTMNQMAPAQGGGPTGGMWNGSIVGLVGGPNAGSAGLAGGYNGANTAQAGFHTPSFLPPSQGSNTQSSRKRDRQVKDVGEDSDSDVQDPLPSAQVSKKARLFLAQPTSRVQHPLPPPFPPNRNEPSRPGNKRQRDDVIVIDDDSESGLAPPRYSKKARRSDGQTIKIETPSMQDWDGTLPPGMTLEDNYNRFRNSQPEGEQPEQTPPLQTHTRRRPTARGARNAPQVLNSSLPDRGADVGSPAMTSSDWDREFQQPQFQDFDGYSDRGEESWEGRRYPSPTQFEYG
jgi:hypothetical protein